MLLVIKYGFKKNKLFNLDCFLGNLLDTVKHETLTDTVKTLREAEKRWQATIAEIEEKIVQTTAKISQKKEAEPTDPNPKGNKQSISVNQRHTIKENDPGNLKAQLEGLDRQVSIYRDKIAKIELRVQELEVLIKENDLRLFDLADFTGERLFVNRRLDQRAKGIVTANKPYYIVRLESADSPNSSFRPIALEGFLVLTADEEGGMATEINVFGPKKTSKGK